MLQTYTRSENYEFPFAQSESEIYKRAAREKFICRAIGRTDRTVTVGPDLMIAGLSIDISADIKQNQFHFFPRKNAVLAEMLADLGYLFGESSNSAVEVAPSANAFQKIWALIHEASQLIGTELPLGTACDDGSGGFRIEWIRERAKLILACSDARNYIYHEIGSDFGIEDDITPDTLSYWLMWLWKMEHGIREP